MSQDVRVEPGRQTSKATPLNEVKADFFKALSHPVRIRVLELLRDGERSVSEMLEEVNVAPPHLSQQLAILKQAGLINGRRSGTNVVYSMAFPELSEVLAVARRILIDVYARRAGILLDLKESEPTDEGPS